jgi:hypothetical protein
MTFAGGDHQARERVAAVVQADRLEAGGGRLARPELTLLKDVGVMAGSMAMTPRRTGGRGY